MIDAVQLAFANKAGRIIKKALKRKSGPTDKELLALARVINRDVSTPRDAAATLLAHGTGTLPLQGVLAPGVDVANVQNVLTQAAKTSTSFTDYIQAAIPALPLDDSAALALSTITGGLIDDEEEE